MSCNCNTCNTDENSIIAKVDPELLVQVEKEYFEFNGYLQLLTQFTSTSPFKPDRERYDEILTEYLESYIKYNLILNELAHNWCVDNGIDFSKNRIEKILADFANESLIITIVTL